VPGVLRHQGLIQHRVGQALQRRRRFTHTGVPRQPQQTLGTPDRRWVRLPFERVSRQLKDLERTVTKRLLQAIEALGCLSGPAELLKGLRLQESIVGF